MAALKLRDEVKALLAERCVKKGKFKLASGKESNVYVDCKGVTLHAPSLAKLAQFFWQSWKDFHPATIAGVSVGGDPLATALALEAGEHGTDAQILLVRKEKKDHGGSVGRAVEGAHFENCKGPIVLVEDVVSTGGSSAKALRYLSDEGYKIDEMWCILDRQMGGTEALSKEFGIPVRALFKLDEF